MFDLNFISSLQMFSDIKTLKAIASRTMFGGAKTGQRMQPPSVGAQFQVSSCREPDNQSTQIIIFEPGHEKTLKMACVPSKDSG